MFCNFYFHSVQAFSWHSVNYVIVQKDRKYKFVCNYWNTFVHSEY